MIPYGGPRAPIRTDLTCRETGRQVHQNGDAGTHATRVGFPVLDLRSFIHNRLQRRAGRGRPARIMHPSQVPGDGWRQTRPDIIEET